MGKSNNQNRLTGVNPLSYMGVEPSTPPNQTIQRRAPNTHDLNYTIGTIWMVLNPIQIWFLVSLVNAVATWVQLFPNSGSGATDFPTNFGTAIEVGGVLNVLGVNVITTTGSGNTVDISLVNGGNGQVLIGGGSDPIWANLTSGDGSVSITNGPNSINLEAASSGANSFPTNSGTAVPLAGVLNIFGDTTLITTTASGHTVTASMVEGLDGQIPIAATGGPTEYANITSSGSITVTNGPNSIDLTASGIVGTSTAFFGSALNIQNNAFGGNLTPYYFGATRAFTTIYDYGSNFYGGSGSGAPATFTAPANGIYWMGIAVSFGFITNTASAKNYFEMGFIVNYSSISPMTYVVQQVNPFACAFDPSGSGGAPGFAWNSGTLIPLSAGDTVVFYLICGPATGSGVSDCPLQGTGIGGGVYSTFCNGYLVKAT